MHESGGLQQTASRLRKMIHTRITNKAPRS